MPQKLSWPFPLQPPRITVTKEPHSHGILILRASAELLVTLCRRQKEKPKAQHLIPRS